MIRTLVFLIGLSLFTAAAAQQKDAPSPMDTTIYYFTDESPEYPGGKDAMMQFISKNLIYPQAAMENGKEGKVIVEFTVNARGQVVNIVPLTKLGYGMEAEVVRVIKKMPLWKPGKQAGKPVNVRMKVPVTFSLQN